MYVIHNYDFDITVDIVKLMLSAKYSSACDPYRYLNVS